MLSEHERGAVDRRVGEASPVREVFDQLPLLVFSMAGPELRLVATTAAYRAFVGRSEVIGLPVREVFAETEEQRIVEIFERARATGEPAELREMRAHFDHDEAGRIEIFVDFTATPRLGPGGEVVGVTVHAVDATERVRERRAAQARTDEAERRYEQALDVIDALQRHLLPEGLPVLPGVRIAASYLLADAGTAAGGDWFDAVALADGRVGLVVGDVVGHGVAASATMGQLRVLLSEQLAATGDVLAAVRAADAAGERVRGARAATVCAAVLDPATGALEYCTAGHPPPLLAPAGGAARYLPTTGAGPLGVGAERGPSAVRAERLGPGDLLLLYSDGILERPGRPLPESAAELARVAADAAAADRIMRGDVELAVERVCAQTVELLTRVTGHTDDITLLAAQLAEPPAPLAVTAVADESALAGIRVALDGWLAGAHVGAGNRDAVRHAAVELITNVLDHAYLDSAEEHAFTLDAALSATGRLSIRVADRGRWREPRPSADRGLGLQMAQRLMDGLRVEHDERGTSVTAELRLTRPARLITAGLAAPPQVGAQSDPLLVLEQPGAPGPRIRVDGPVDAATTATVRREVLFAGSTGARSLTVDLTGVTHLASAGVAALHGLVALHRENGTELVLFAPPGTNAGLVLSLVGLAHRTADPDSDSDPDSDPDLGSAEEKDGEGGG